MSIDRIAVLGGGAWGTALAQTCARAGRNVTLWERDAGNAEHLAGKRESRFLPGVRLDDGIKVTRGACRSGARRGDPAGGAGAGDALRGQGAGADNARPARRSSPAPRASNTARTSS